MRSHRHDAKVQEAEERGHEAREDGSRRPGVLPVEQVCHCGEEVNERLGLTRQTSFLFVFKRQDFHCEVKADFKL